MIDKFDGEHRFLSNFFIEPDGSHVEGEFQGMKSSPPSMFMKRLSPSEAKKAGRKVTLRPDWEKVKLSVMFDLVFTKFKDHPTLAAKLLATGDQELVEGNWWGDKFWGVCNGVGKNNLGKILMEVREIIRMAQ